MTGKPAPRGGYFLLCLAATSALVTFVWLVFSPALPGIVHFDDWGNLTGLSTIRDFDSAWRWMREGAAGPLGRPLALATFALQYYEWPRPEAFLYWNIGFHIVNALLAFWLSALVARCLGHTNAGQVAVGFLAALAWAVLPLLNSSVLFIVQRMTVLSATFVLIGLIAYLKVRAAPNSPWPRQVAALLVLAVSGVLAMLAKESGALIAVYALVLELLLIAQARMRRPRLAAVALLLASVLLVGGMLQFARWSECTELCRGFTLWQRLGSQGVLLLVYLKGLFVPVASDLNPFRFELLLLDHPNMQWGAVLWLGLMASPLIVWSLEWRLRALALVLAWFFWGHIMESGWVSLEPYFAHRNYLPALGPAFALVAWALAPREGAALWRGIGVAYLLMLATVSWMNASLWGNRALAAEIWAIEQPRSTRAAVNLAYYLEQTQGLGTAQHYLDRAMIEQRDGTGLRMQSLISACRVDPDGNHADLVSNVVHAIPTQRYEGWAVGLMEKLLDVAIQQGCNGVTATEVDTIAATFLDRPAYQCSAAEVHNLLSARAIAALHQGQAEKGLDFFLKALKSSLSYVTVSYAFSIAREQKNTDAISKLSQLVTEAPAPRGSTAAEWQQLVDDIHASLHK